jgi:hypothetical protein
MGTETRRHLSIALAVAGAVLAVAGGIGLYLRAEVFNAEAFGDHAVEALDDREVREALADRITDQAVASGPDELVNGTPLLRSVVEGALQSSAFRSAFRQGAVSLYGIVVDGDPDRISLTIGDLNVIVAAAAESASPQLADQIPRDLGSRLVEVSESDFAVEAAQVAEDVRFLALLLPALALLCFGGAVALATDRRQVVLIGCASAAIATGAALAAMLMARSMLLSQFEEETVELAVSALWDAFLGGLQTWLLMGGCFAVILTAAAATAREVDAVEPARRLARLVIRTPARPAARLARVAAIAAGSLLLLLRPDLALHVVAVAAGAYGLFYASCEVLALLAPGAGRARERRAGRWRWPPSGREIAGGALVAAAILAVSVILVRGDGDDEVRRPAGPVTRCNGHAALCDRTLDDVAFPATHNSMSAAELPGWYTPNQRRGMQRQLDDGIRAFLIDTHYGVARPGGFVLTDLTKEDRGKVTEAAVEELGEEGADRFIALHDRYAARGGEGTPGTYLCHVVCELGATKLTTALGWVKDFLDTHPDEVIVLFVEDVVTPEEAAVAFSDSGLLRYAYEHGPGSPFPTLRELIESDERLFVMAERTGGGAEFPWYHQGFDLTQETPFTFGSPAELADPAISCAPNRGEDGNPLFQLNHWIERIPRSPATAREVNAFDFLEGRSRECDRRRGLLSNLLAVDYYDEGDVLEVARALNGIPRDERPIHRQTGGP